MLVHIVFRLCTMKDFSRIYMALVYYFYSTYSAFYYKVRFNLFLMYCLILIIFIRTNHFYISVDDILIRMPLMYHGRDTIYFLSEQSYFWPFTIIMNNKICFEYTMIWEAERCCSQINMTLLQKAHVVVAVIKNRNR